MAPELKLPLTVRQAQRLMSRDPWAYRRLNGETRQVRDIVSAALGLRGEFYRQAIRARLDKLAAERGPNHILIAAPAASPEAPSPGESRPKGTDEVRPQGQDPSEDSPFHGGDGASGEVEGGPPSQGGDNGELGAEQGSASGRGSAPASDPVSPSDTGDEPEPSAPETGDTSGEGAHQPDSGNNPGHGEGDSRESSSDAASAPASRPDPGVNPAMPSADGSEEDVSMLTGRANAEESADSEADERPDGQAKESGDADPASENSGEYRYRRNSGGTRQGSRVSRTEHGGVYAELRAAKIDPAIARQARRALARLLEGGETESGPRYDWQEFCERLVTFRPLAPARREEEGRPAILVLADVSGSCSSFSGESLIVARAVASLGMPGADVIVVSHSNGFPEEWQVNGGKPREVGSIGWGDTETALDWYERTLRRYRVEAVVALGDWDAEWLYRHLALQPAVRRFVWLDNWSCNYFERPAARPDKFNEWSGGDWPRAARRKATYVVGCAGAPDFVEGLRLALRGE